MLPPGSELSRASQGPASNNRMLFSLHQIDLQGLASATNDLLVLSCIREPLPLPLHVSDSQSEGDEFFMTSSPQGLSGWSKRKVAFLLVVTSIPWYLCYLPSFPTLPLRLTPPYPNPQSICFSPLYDQFSSNASPILVLGDTRAEWLL